MRGKLVAGSGKALRAAIIGVPIVTVALLNASPAAAGDDGTVVFRVEIRGDAPPDASFLVLRDTEPPSIIEPGTFVCGPMENPYTKAGPVCASGGSYETEITLPIGTELQYGFLLDSGWPAVGEVGTSEVLLEGDITVQSATQTVTLVHDFSGSSLLPDTAATAPARGLDSGWTLVIVVALVFSGLGDRRAARGRELPSPVGHT